MEYAYRFWRRLVNFALETKAGNEAFCENNKNILRNQSQIDSAISNKTFSRSLKQSVKKLFLPKIQSSIY